MITNVLLQSGELSQEILLISNDFPRGLMPSLCAPPCWTDVLRRLQTGIRALGS